MNARASNPPRRTMINITQIAIPNAIIMNDVFMNYVLLKFIILIRLKAMSGPLALYVKNILWACPEYTIELLL